MKKRILLLLSLFLCFTMAQAQDLQEITLEGVTPGNLLTAVKGKAPDYKTVAGLTVSGTIDARDIKIMRDSLISLVVINLANATIDAYTGTEGTKTNSTAAVVYLANTWPIDAFRYNKTLASITLLVSLKTIDKDAFFKCEKLEEVIIPDGVDSIGTQAFRMCYALKSIKLPASLKRMSDGLFQECSSLETVELPPHLEVVGGFSGCTALKTFVIPPTVKIIQSYAFQYSGLTYIEVPATVTSLGNSTFSGCRSLVTAKICANVLNLGKYGSFFSDCTSLKELVLPATLVYGTQLTASKSLESIYSYNPVPPMDFYFADETYTDATVYVPKGALQAYKEAEAWKQFTKIVEMDATAVPDVTNTPVTLSVSPNPVTDNEITVTLPEADDNAVIRIVSLTGLTILQQPVSKGSTQARIDVSKLSKGIYLINYSDDAVKNNNVKLINNFN